MRRLTHKALFERYKDSAVLLRCTQYARWTLPQLMSEFTELQSGQTTTVERDFQEIGALLTNNLGAKLAGLLFPSSRPFFKTKVSAELKAIAKRRGVAEDELQGGLSRLEMDACAQLFLNASYAQLVLALKHLIITGNVLLYRNSKSGKSQAFGLQQYTVRRDGEGNALDIILRQFTDFEALSPDIQAVLRTRSAGKYKPENEGHNRVELFTRIKRDFVVVDGVLTPQVVYNITQEVDGISVGTPGSYPEHLCPWQAVCWSLIPGENYGRGLVEDYAGGFAKLSDQSHAAALYGIEIMKVVNLVAPGMGADVDTLQAAETGEYVLGSKESVTPYESGDAQKLQQLEAMIESTFNRLARAFMYKGSTRNAERVTAFELKQDAMEAETTLGGTYSSLSAALQIPLANILITEADPTILEGLLTGDMKLEIIAGIPALGRASDVQNLAAGAQDAAAIIPALTQVDTRVDPQKVFNMIMAGASVDVTQLFKSKERIKEEEDAARQEQLGQQQIAATTTLKDQAAQLQQLGV